MNPLPPPIVEAIDFEKSNEVNGSVRQDDFYSTPSGTAEADAGTILRLEEDVDTASYLLPPATAMSRYLYQTKTLQGNLVPTSACILWPYLPKSHKDGYPVVAWAHGTSGVFAGGAPSNHKNLWQHFLAPYQLVGQGYVVVAPDYAGLGVCKTATGQPIAHEYLSGPSQANDIVYAIQAAQHVFKELSKDFVVIGHSQGGGAAWATAQRQVDIPLDNFLGAVAISPTTSALDQPEPLRSVLLAAICPGLAAAFPEFAPADLLTTEGQQILQLIEESGAGMASGLALLHGQNTLRPDWAENKHLQAYHALVSNGGKKIQGPLLVIHGEKDDRISATVALDAANQTAEQHPSSLLDFVLLPNVGHVPALQASQSLWMRWIEDRFAGHNEVEPGYRHRTLSPVRKLASYHAEQNWYLEPATKFYHAP